MINPASEAQLAEAVRDAKGPLKVIGGGTRPIGAPVTGEALTTRGLSGITLYEPGALTIVALSGTPLEEVEAALAKENQRLPFEPADYRGVFGTEGTPTIGGVVAANISGPRRIQAGACRDSLIGVRFVDGSGQALKNGGRVMKNVTGYDLVKLLAGSYGTLGVISEVSFKLLPGIAASATLTLKGQTVAEAVATLSKALGSPFEVSGAAYRNGDTFLRIEGFADSVAYRTEQLSNLLGGDIEVESDKEAVAGLWTAIGALDGFGTEGQDIWRISVKPSDAPSLIEALPASDTLIDWGGGLIWAACAPGTDLRAKAPEISGHRTLFRASDETKQKLGAFHPEPAPIVALNEGLRSKFDPRSILNPGLMG
ncbi:MAG: glycolate oxidase subunit GlcE [Litoreibacter sp.]|nr:glycolate oxidase subunit GlcE [Litoreibacter sp.]